MCAATGSGAKDDDFVDELYSSEIPLVPTQRRKRSTTLAAGTARSSHSDKIDKTPG